MRYGYPVMKMEHHFEFIMSTFSRGNRAEEGEEPDACDPIFNLTEHHVDKEG